MADVNNNAAQNGEATELRQRLGRQAAWNAGKIDDIVLMDNPTDEGITALLEERYKDDNIYTYMGPVLISMNPYKKVKDLYKNDMKHEYHSAYPYELAPHLYSLAEDAYRTMRDTGKPQTVIISGESGAGKTEASKIMLDYISAVSVSGLATEAVKKAILECNPVLEAFGNAKTLKNDNSSRFGKYMDLYFNFKGQLEGGYITTSMLEKTRVVNQRKGERNFHIFYQLCAGADEVLRRDLNIVNAKQFAYLTRDPDSMTIEGVNDKDQFRATIKSMTDMGITMTEQMEIFRVVAGVLHLGNIKFGPVRVGNQDGSEILNMEDCFKTVCLILQVEEEALKTALTFKNITAHGQTTAVPQTPEMASFNRDALAKGIYERLFNWLVRRVNAAIRRPDDARYSIGILDIYGFEIYDDNSFEQLCINYINEKLQEQIQAALKEEQEEYVAEGVAWHGIRHHNSDECVKLIEGKPMGLLSLLDEECLFPDSNDRNYFNKINNQFKTHPYYEIPRFQKSATSMIFGLKHFAAKVPYEVAGWLDKNRDTLLADLILVMQTSGTDLIKQLFPENEVIETKGKLQKTAASQFRAAVQGLTGKMVGKKSHFVRCLKPNHEKKPDAPDHALVLDQVRYLGIVENAHIRRAGYYYKMDYEKFLDRYKLTCPDTWPTWHGSAASGSEAIMKHMGLDGQYAMGRTKIFIQSPLVIFALDDAIQARKSEMATLIQKTWRRYKARQAYLTTKHLAKTLDIAYEDTDVAFKQLVSQYNATGEKTRRLLVVAEKGLYLMDPSTFKVSRRIEIKQIGTVLASPLNDGIFVINVNGDSDVMLDADEKKSEIIKYIMDAYEKQTKQILVMDIGDQFSWKPIIGVEKKIKWVKNPDVKHTTVQLDEEGNFIVNVRPMIDVFDGQKMRRRASFSKEMHGDYIKLQNSPLMEQLKKDFGDTTVHFSAVINKYNKKYKVQERVLMITEKAVYNLDPHGYLINRRIPLKKIKAASVSALTDGFFVLHVPDEYDYLMNSTKKTEILQVLAECYTNATRQNLKLNVKNNIQYAVNKHGLIKELHFKEDPHIQETTLRVAKHGADILVKFENVVRDAQVELEMIKDVYKGQKMRRRGTLLRWHMGDYLHMEKSKFMQATNKKFGDKRIIFSGLVNKINKKYKVQERKLIITNQAIYNMDKDGEKVNRRIPIKNVAGISVSSFRDGFFVVRVPDEYDYFYETYKKTEVIKHICDQYRKLTGKELFVQIDDKFEYCPVKGEKSVRTIEFRPDNTIVGSMIEPKDSGVLILVNNSDEIDDFENGDLGMVDKQTSVYSGRKMRKRGSFEREQLGDYLRWAEAPHVKRLFKQYGDTQLLFSSAIDKINKKNQKQARFIVISDKAVYNIDPDKLVVKRRIPLEDIDGVSLSSLTDGYFVMHVPKEYDYMYESDKKTELIDVLSKAIQKKCNREVKVNVGDKFEYSPDGKGLRTCSFVLDENVPETTLENIGNGLIVHVKHEEPSVVLEAALIHVKDQPKPIEVRSSTVMVKLKKRWKYKLEIRFYVNEKLQGCKFYEKIDTVTERREYVSTVADLEPRDERYVIMLPERDVIWSLLSKTRVKAKLVDPFGKVLLAVRFVYGIATYNNF